MGVYSQDGGGNINPPENSVGVFSPQLLSGGQTQSTHFTTQGYITPMAGAVLQSAHFQIVDITIQDNFLPGVIE